MTKRILIAMAFACAAGAAARAAVVPIKLVLTGSTGRYTCKAEPPHVEVDPGDIVRFNVSANTNRVGQAVEKASGSTNIFGGANDFPADGGGSVNTPAAAGSPGDDFTYDINFYDKSNKLLCHSDPDICIKNSSGGCGAGLGNGHGHGHGHGKPDAKPSPTPHP
jgi:hypothetical protein